MKKGYVIRWGLNSEGPTIGALMETCGYDGSMLDWSDIQPYWLVAEMDREIVGCVQLGYCKPMARIDMAGCKVEGHRGAAIYRDLILAAILALKDFGAQTVMGFVPFDRKPIKRFYQKCGAGILTQGHLIELRVQDGQQHHDSNNPEPAADRASSEAA